VGIRGRVYARPHNAHQERYSSAGKENGTFTRPSAMLRRKDLYKVHEPR
jgi:hypothetical protein